jgi:membrane-bound serine protease (ClpP class)
VGAHATALKPLAPEGHVLVEGEIWRAVSEAPVEKGTSLRVVSHEQQLLRVVPDATTQPPLTTA